MSSAERAALERAISTDRLTTYRRAAAAAGCDVLDLYLWDRDAAAAVLADIAILESETVERELRAAQGSTSVSEIERLSDLRSRELITAEEFTAAKRQLLGL